MELTSQMLLILANFSAVVPFAFAISDSESPASTVTEGSAVSTVSTGAASVCCGRCLNNYRSNSCRCCISGCRYGDHGGRHFHLGCGGW